MSPLRGVLGVCVCVCVLGRLSQAAARKQKLEAQGRLAGGAGADGPVDFMYRTAEQRRREEEAERQQFVMSNPLSC